MALERVYDAGVWNTKVDPGGGSQPGTVLPVADPAGVTVDTTTYDDPIAGGGAKLTTLVFPGDAGAIAIALAGDAYPRWLMASDANDGLYVGDGTSDPYNGANLSQQSGLFRFSGGFSAGGGKIRNAQEGVDPSDAATVSQLVAPSIQAYHYTAFANPNGNLKITAGSNYVGAAGNGLTVRFRPSGSSGHAVATVGGGFLLDFVFDSDVIAQDVIDFFAAHPEDDPFFTLVLSPSSNGTGLVEAFSPVALIGGVG